MSTVLADQTDHDRHAEARPPLVEVVLPVYNEERDLEASVRRLRRYLDHDFPFAALVTIADNGSTDATPKVAAMLAASLRGVRVVALDQKGRGRALRAVWSTSAAPVVGYMDVDLSTSLDALLPLVAPLLSGHSDLAIGSRLAPGARVLRGPRRELISRSYNLLLRAVLHSRFSDAQCGFKAIRTDVARALLPDVSDDEWFFDTELLALAERRGLRIHEVAVDWVDDPDSRVEILHTAWCDLRGLGRVAWGRCRTGPGGGPPVAPDRPWPDVALAGFARVGVLSTAAYLLLFMGLRPWWGALTANAGALALCTIGNTVAHGRVTFAPRRPFRPRDQVLGTLVALATSLVCTSAALTVLARLGAGSLGAQVAALVLATAVAALVRFVLFGAWVFRHRGVVDASGPKGPGTGSGVDAGPGVVRGIAR